MDNCENNKQEMESIPIPDTVQSDIPPEGNLSIMNGFKLPQDGKLGFFHAPTRLNQSALQEWITARRNSFRPWSVFFSSSKFRQPVSFARLPKKINKNLEYFQSNYIFVYIGLFLYCLITSPLLLITILIVFSLCYWVFNKNQNQSVRVFGKELSIVQQYCVVGLVSLPMFYWAGAGAALFWVMGVSCVLILLHASFYDVDSLLASDEQSFELTMEQVV